MSVAHIVMTQVILALISAARINVVNTMLAQTDMAYISKAKLNDTVRKFEITVISTLL